MAHSSNSPWPFSALSLILLLLLTHFNGGDSTLIKSKATNAHLTTETGWYKQDFWKYLGANVTLVSERIYRDGLACGSCLQVKCIDQTHCTNNSVILVVVGSGYGGENDFLINWEAYTQFFPKGTNFQFPGGIDIVYKRVACQYHHHISIWVEHSSPSFMQLVFWYVGGSRDIVAVQLREERELNWRDMKLRNGSPVWWINFWDEYGRSLKENVVVRFNMSDSSRCGWTYASTVIPFSDAHAWGVGVKYDSGFQLN
ncbi:hypothetical protein SUGI_0031380 [Cryptomeria japonica]|uniref:expansin-like B1 n=1 Tax=Cryptomeria japonica TaxID=3369 RepID=UPI0024089D1C|nr:expansin-like B1 [Cryptomeria japonica]GLJ06076.1 hypothetical protein SUGI_0031380 [Cryptomeria japonica]